MRILMVHNDYGRQSGEERAAESIATLLEQNGHRVSWFRKSSAQLLNSKIGAAKAFFTGIHSSRSKREIEQELDANEYDLVQVQNLYPLLSPSILKPIRQRKIPLVMRCPNYRLFCPNGLHLSREEVCEKCLGGKEYWCVLKNCESSLPKSIGYAARTATARLSGSIRNNVDIFVVLTEFQRQRFLAQGIPEDQLAIVPNYAEAPAAVGYDSPGEFVSYLGRPSPEKGIWEFLEAARALPNVPFAVAGAPAALPAAVEAAPPNVKFVGFLGGEDLSRFLQQTRILVVPSRCFEGFPNTIVQAMSYARPVICSRNGGMPEIVKEDVTGLLYDSTSVPELVDRIRRLYGDLDRCRTMGFAGRERAAAEFDGTACYAKLMNAYTMAFKRYGLAMAQ
jgi:glycosyltransferase involved in cell wall biosynthesis